MCCWEMLNFAYLIIFYFFDVARHLWSNLQTCKLFLGGKAFECTKCKATFKFFFQHFWLFYAFLVRMTACTLHIKWFPWHQEPKWPQWPQQPQQPQWPQWPQQPHFIKKPLFWSKNVYFWWFAAFYYLKNALKSQSDSKFLEEQEVFTNWTIDGVQHQKNKKWLDRQNLAFLNNT